MASPARIEPLPAPGPGSRRLRYPRRAIAMDYARSAAGTLLTLGPLALVGPPPVVSGVLGALALLFVAYGVRTFVRQRTLIALSGQGIAVLGPRRRALAWSEVGGIRLRHLPRRRETRGWMRLELRGRDRATGRTVRLAVDWELEAFDEVVARAVHAAAANGARPSFATRANLARLGIRWPGNATKPA